MVTVLNTGKTTNPYLAACARNIWYLASVHDTDLQYVHIRGENNKVADCLSRWAGSEKDWHLLRAPVPNPAWCAVSTDMLVRSQMCLFVCKCGFRCKLCLKMLYFVSDSRVLRPLVTKASTRLNKAFRPKTQASYTATGAADVECKCSVCVLGVLVV